MSDIVVVVEKVLLFQFQHHAADDNQYLPTRYHPNNRKIIHFPMYHLNSIVVYYFVVVAVADLLILLVDDECH